MTCSNKRNLYSEYKYRAAHRNKVFDISKESFNRISQGECFYCGTPFDKNYDGKLLNGIDRWDNSKGYEDDNCVPSCWICNRAKGDLTIEEFQAWAIRLSERVNEVSKITCPDKANVINMQRQESSNLSYFKSYEDDVKKRLSDILSAFTFIAPSLAEKIIKKANTSRYVLEHVVKFTYTIDNIMYPQSIKVLSSKFDMPEYVKGLDVSKIDFSHIQNILERVSVSKKELKIFYQHMI